MNIDYMNNTKNTLCWNALDFSTAPEEDEEAIEEQGKCAGEITGRILNLSVKFKVIYIFDNKLS